MISPVNKSQFRLLKQYTDCQDIWWQNWQSRHFSIYERLVIDIYCISSIKRVPIPFCVFWSFFFYFFFSTLGLLERTPAGMRICAILSQSDCFKVFMVKYVKCRVQKVSKLPSGICKRSRHRSDCSSQDSQLCHPNSEGWDQPAVYKWSSCGYWTIKENSDDFSLTTRMHRHTINDRFSHDVAHKPATHPYDKSCVAIFSLIFHLNHLCHGEPIWLTSIMGPFSILERATGIILF